ncbi:chromosome segregation ATPase [Nodularia harveyana UHCC-0300]|uniref:Chromosome segregation ATPase n=1 Tax=Nodularia harveyana UHCC-0300 TaxID=2974287 RepID=A0ABU5UEU0_9CYAN|nr:chromosome segregation ATPase [Nodularia harveyana]MEA5582055.1 chromosome segregation ATPase [Nodularia harveyana UHCC-0300]
MTQRDIPESWPPSRSGEPDDINRLSRTPQFGETQAFGVRAMGSMSQSVKGKKQDSSELPLNNQSAESSLDSHGSGKFPGWTKNWLLWGIILTFIPGGVGFLAMATLLKLPTAPSCPEIARPFVSAAVKLHCAQVSASKQNVNDLLEAIALVRKIPDDHPLRGEIDRFLTEWSQDVLRLADESFQSGNLEEAIATARKIPEDLPPYKLVNEQITKWQSIWSEAEDIYKSTEAEVKERRWQTSFMLSAKLLRVNNDYWSSVKYDQLNNLITSAREDGDKLANAESLANTKVVDNLLKAIKLSESIRPESYLYEKAQELIPQIGGKMLELAKASLDRRDANTALDIARQIPEKARLESEVEDFMTLTDARRSAWIGTVSGLETAIFQAQQVDASRTIYGEAQELIARWQLEIEDVARLEKARTLASQGTLEYLTAAISEVRLISGNNPRASEARKEINRWQNQVETIEDRPILERAQQLAWLNDINSLQAAISEAGQIRRGRALYSEAQRKISGWTATVQRIQDQPYLDQARTLARSGDLTAAINTAQPIASSGRSLSRTAKKAIEDWRGQIQAKENWNRAKAVAVRATPEALSQAIGIAERVPRNSTLRMDVNIGINQWSQQLFDIARSQGDVNILRAIETAKLIPRSSSVYSRAQQQIENWQSFLNPEPPPEIQPIIPNNEQPIVIPRNEQPILPSNEPPVPLILE